VAATEIAETSGAARGLAAQGLGFLAIGGLSALGYVLLAGALVPRLPMVPAPLVSFCCYSLFVLPAYFGHRRFSFRSDAPHRRALPRYVATQGLGLTLAAAFSFLAYHVAGLGGFAASGAVIVLTSAVNFAVLKLWAFAHSDGRGETRVEF
jgi:putative flippase GtrA